MPDAFSGCPPHTRPLPFNERERYGAGNVAARGEKCKIGQGTTLKVNSPRRPDTSKPRSDEYLSETRLPSAVMKVELTSKQNLTGATGSEPD